MTEKILSLAEITEIERAYALGAPTLGRAAAALLARWQLPLRDDETLLRLSFLSWYREHEPEWLTGLTGAMPSVEALVTERGGEAGVPAEFLFTMGFLWNCFAPLQADEAEYKAKARAWVAEAAKVEPTSRLFSEWPFLFGDAPESKGARLYVERELHARFSGRGALGEYLHHSVSVRLRPIGPR